MSKKTEKASYIGEQIGVNKLKNTLTRDIDIMDEAFKISGENDQLAYHISKMKGFANKYFGCCYKTHDEDFAVISIPKAEKLINKVFEKGLQTFAKAEESQPQLDTLEQAEKQSTEMNDILEESQKPNKRGKGWKKVLVDGRTQLVYDVDKKRTREVLDELDGKTHTYGGLMLAKDPIAYLGGIQIGDKIQYKSKKSNKVVTEKVSNISVFKKACVPDSYVFYMRNSEKVTHKDFA